MTLISSDDDRDLRDRFAAARREDAALAPDFAALQRRRPARDKKPAWAKWVAAAAMLMIAALLLTQFYPRRPAPPVVSITEWKSATDFLLETPGHELLESVPQIGEWPQGLTVPSASPAPSRKKAS